MFVGGKEEGISFHLWSLQEKLFGLRNNKNKMSVS